MADTSMASEILMNEMMTTDEMVAWAILTIQFAECKQYAKFKDDNPNKQPSSNHLNVELAYSILHTYAKHYGAKTLISDKGKPASNEYIDNLIDSAIGSYEDDDFEQ